MKRNIFKLSDLSISNILNDDEAYNNLPECLSESLYTFDPFTDIVNYYKNQLDNNYNENSEIKKFRINCQDIDTIFLNK